MAVGGDRRRAGAVRHAAARRGVDVTVTLSDHGPARSTLPAEERRPRRPTTRSSQPPSGSELRDLGSANVALRPSGSGPRQREGAASSPDRPFPGHFLPDPANAHPCGHPQFAAGSAGAVDRTASRPVCRPITRAPQLRAPPASLRTSSGRAGHAGPGALGDLAGQLTGRPARVAGEDPQPGEPSGELGRVGVEVDEVDVAGDPAQAALVARGRRRGRRPGTAPCRSRTARPRGRRRARRPGRTSRAARRGSRPGWAGRGRRRACRCRSGRARRRRCRRTWGRSAPASRRAATGADVVERADGERGDRRGAASTGRGPRRRSGLGIGRRGHRGHRCQCAPLGAARRSALRRREQPSSLPAATNSGAVPGPAVTLRTPASA